MSLLDDVSIVVTPNGYKAGELYSVVPVPTEGSEKIINGSNTIAGANWNANSNWDKTVAGLFSCDGTSSADINQGGNLPTVNLQYIISFEILSINSGGKFVANYGGVVGTNRTSVGVYSEIITAANSTERIRVRPNATGTVGSVTGISVKEYTSADMDVTRATAATRVDENGLVNYAEVIGSEEVTNGDFTTDLSGWTLSVDTPPTWDNGMMKMQSDGATFSRADQSFSTVLGKLYTFVFEKLINNNQVAIKIGTSQGDSSLLNLTPATAQTYSYSFTATSSTSWIRAEDGSGTTGAYLSGFSVKQVDRDNVPRIDYTGGGCPHILAEPQRTNLVTYSSDLTNAFYQLSGIEVVTESAISSPDGTSYGYTIVPTSATSSHYFNYDYTNLTVAIGVDVTYSIFIKPNGYNFIQIASSTGFASKFQNFELTGDGVIGTGDVDGKTIEKIGDYYKISVTQVSITANPRFLLIPSPTALATRNPSFTGNGTDGVLGWGVQIEVGSFPTSLIPTSGSTVTRNQDQFTRDGIGSLINSTEGVLFLEMAALSDDLSARRISINDGSYNNIVEIGYTSGSNEIKNRVKSGGGTQANMNYTAPSILSDLKIALKWKVNDFAVWVNGVEVATDTLGTAPIGLSQISFDRGDGTQNYFGKVKQLQVYKTALTDEQLIQLTGESGTDFYESYAEMAAALNYTIQ